MAMRSIMKRTPSTFPTIDRVFTQFFNEPFFETLPGVLAGDEGALAVDVSEDETSVLVRASLPGFKKEDVQIEIHDGVLTIKAEHDEEQEETGERFYRRERRFGSTSRRIALPSVVREDEARADLTDGVLTLRLPKAKDAVARKIAIS
jgi:HSP20 family protein